MEIVAKPKWTKGRKMMMKPEIVERMRDLLDKIKSPPANDSIELAACDELTRLFAEHSIEIIEDLEHVGQDKDKVGMVVSKCKECSGLKQQLKHYKEDARRKSHALAAGGSALDAAAYSLNHRGIPPTDSAIIRELRGWADCSIANWDPKFATGKY